jgi:trk system potassium uptake protein TrkA
VYILVVGAGKVGWNLARELIAKDNEVTLVEANQRRYQTVEEELEHSVQYGDGSELWVLERAGIERAEMVIAVTGDDEDNLLICQMAREKYGVDRVIARCNNPRNLPHFELLGVKPAVSATDLILRLIEHEVPKYGMIHLLDLPQEELEIIELDVSVGSDADGRSVRDLNLPDGSLLISIVRDGRGFIPRADSVVQAADKVIVVLETGLEEQITARFGAAGSEAA